MSSKVEIVNVALSQLGVERITSFTDTTNNARYIDTIYEIVSQEVMAMGPWPSTKRRATLAQLSTTPDFGFAYQYQLPTDPKCLRVLRVYEERLGDIAYQIEGDKLLTDESTVSILYIAEVTNSEEYDTYLRQAIIESLIARSAYKFLGQSNVAAALVAQAEKKLEELLHVASSQGSVDELPSDTYIDVRRG